MKLLHRTTRRVAVTEQGERVYHWAQRILDEVEHLLQEVDVTRRQPRQGSELMRPGMAGGHVREVRGIDAPTREQQAGERDLRRDLAPSALLEDHAICHATRSARAGR